MFMNYPGAVCTLQQKRFIRKLCDDLKQPYPDFEQLKRGEAHRMISNMLHQIKLNESGKDVG